LKKLTFLVSMILACVAFSAADSITITHGYGTLSGAGLESALYAFTFSGPGGGIDVPGVLGDAGIGGGLPDCNPCNPLTTNIELLRDIGATILQGDRFVQGILLFEPVSFSSSLAPNGILTVDYRATSDVSLQGLVCVGNPDTGVCIPSGPSFVSNPSQLWYVQATFAPFQGQYVFNNATFSTSPVPEPGTLLLLGTGLVGIMGAARKKFFH
jgi:PEP-CTERM motif